MSAALGTLDYPQVDTTGSANPLQTYLDQVSHLHGFVDRTQAALQPQVQPPPAMDFPWANAPVGNEHTEAPNPNPWDTASVLPVARRSVGLGEYEYAPAIPGGVQPLIDLATQGPASGTVTPEQSTALASAIILGGLGRRASPNVLEAAAASPERAALGADLLKFPTEAKGQTPAIQVTPKGGGDPVSVPVRPSSDDIHDTVASNFKYGQDVGPTTVPMDRLQGGVDLAQPKEAARVDELAGQMSGPDGYVSRPIVDTDGNVIEGQHRIEAMRQLGVTQVPVHLVQDLAKDVDAPALEAAIKKAQPGMHPDHVQQLAQNVLEAHADMGSPAGVREAYEQPKGFEPAWEGALTHLEGQTQNALAKTFLSNSATLGDEGGAAAGGINDRGPQAQNALVGRDGAAGRVGEGGGGSDAGGAPASGRSAYQARSITPSEALVNPTAVRAFEPVRSIEGASTPVYHELDAGQGGAEAFHQAVDAARQAHPEGAAVTLHAPDDYAGMRLFTTPNRDAGFALNGDDIVSVFKHPDAPHRGVTQSMLDVATSQGGRRLDAFDPVLPRIYAKSGFRAVARLPWNDDYAPPGWNPKNGRPDVVFMAHDPAQAGHYSASHGPQVADYDQGVQAQRDALAPKNALASTEPAPRQNIFQRLLGDNRGGGPNPLQRFQGVSTLPGAARAEEPAPLAPGEADRVSTRLPKAKTLDYDPHQTQDMRVDLDAARAHPDSYAKNVGLIREQPAMNVGRLKNPDSISDRFVAHLKDNILAIYDRMSGMDPDVVRRAQGWYDGANKIAGQMAEKYGYSKRQMAGVLASLSPQKDWFQNVDLARRLMDTVQRMGNRSATPEMKAWAKQWTENAEKDPEEPKASVEKFRAAVARNGNRPLSQITDNYDRAVWVRMYDEAHNLDRGYRVVTPEGGYGARATTNKGADQKVTWGSFNEIAKAMNALKEDSTANISQSVGGAHKVRNFYNNIISPNAPHGDITVDTHAIAGALLRALGGSTRSVAQGLGTGGNVSSPASTGIRGLYAHYAEAYRQAAEERGVLPRQMQSVTWEGTRGLFSPEQRRDVKFVEMIDNIWRQHAKGTLDGPTARQKIFDAAGGINPPEWTAP